MNTATKLRKIQMPAGEPLHLCDLVAYQEGTATSRSLIKHAGGTLTLFAFDVGQGLTEHSAAYDALVQIMEGNAERYYFGKPYRVQAGEAILLPANQPYALAALAPFKMPLTMIRA